MATPNRQRKASLGAILDQDELATPPPELDAIVAESTSSSDSEGDALGDTGSVPPVAADHECCVECQDQTATMYCETCAESFCEVCCAMLHRTGNRRRHQRAKLAQGKSPSPSAPTTNQSTAQSKTEPEEVPTASEDLQVGFDRMAM
ncbi:hypothetical protein IWQ62_004473, partial [Dispira parvispora]